MVRSRSRSPGPDRRRRSQSPAGDRSRRQRNHGGFRWKDKRPRNDQNHDDDRRLERGYRERYRPQSPRRDRSRERYGNRGRDRPVNTAPARHPEPDRDERHEPKAAPKKAPVVAPAPPGEEMIIVHVNDRLGTKAAIPCLASDPIKLFKAQVAARIGRESHEILLKRQGERPFKDQLTLQDYGVSNGVQLDLEVDTGD